MTEDTKWRVEEIGSGYAVQYLSRGEHRDEDYWVSIGTWDAANKCAVFPKAWAEEIARALQGTDKEMLEAVKEAHAALRGVETGCDPLAVPLEPMRAVRAALARLERWTK